jgi:hypothetical protein
VASLRGPFLLLLVGVLMVFWPAIDRQLGLDLPYGGSVSAAGIAVVIFGVLLLARALAGLFSRGDD